MEFDKLAGQAVGLIICIYLIYVLGDVMRENRDLLIAMRDKIDLIYEVVTK